MNRRDEVDTTQIRYRGLTEKDQVLDDSPCSHLPSDAGNVACQFVLDGLPGGPMSMQLARRQMVVSEMALSRFRGSVAGNIDEAVEGVFEAVSESEGGPSTLNVRAGQQAACRKCAEITTQWAVLEGDLGNSLRQYCPED